MSINRYQSPDFSLRQLQYAVAVADTGGFGTGAEVCGVSQPSLSAQVAKLESALGVQLFERGSRSVVLTVAGERLMRVFRDALTAGAAVEVAAATLRDPYAIPVRVAVIPTIAPYLLPSVVDALTPDRGPRVHWLELQTQRAEEALSNGSVDALIIADPPVDPSLVVHKLGWEPFVTAVSRGVEGPSPVTMEWLHSRDVLLLDDGHCLREHAVSLCMLPSARESPYRATSLPTLVQMVSAGMGVSVLPAMAVENECSRSRIEVRRFAGATVGRTLRMAWRAHHPLGEILAELAGVIETSFAEVVARSEQRIDSERL